MSAKKPGENEQAPEATPEEKLATVQKQNADLMEDLTAANQVNADLQNKVEELELKLSKAGQIPAPEEKKKHVLPSKSFTVAKQEYLFNSPVFTNPLDGYKIITAEEALTNKPLLEHLVEIGAGVIRRKTK